jgi:hypothetical protein
MTDPMYRRLTEKRRREKRLLDKRVKSCYAVSTPRKKELAR